MLPEPSSTSAVATASSPSVATQGPDAAPILHWQTTRHRLNLSRVQVMGIVNVTPDSFSDGGRSLDPLDAQRRCEALVQEGADILDIGGESTRPGAPAVPAAEELRRVLPVLRVALTLGVPVSVDTCKAEVMRAVLEAGADIINDVQALRAPQALAVCAAHPRAGVCLMHMKGDPQTMQAQARYDDVTREVGQFLAERVQHAQAAGIASDRIAIDPGYGFAKTLEHNCRLMQQQRELLRLGLPLLVGMSRKSMLGALTGGRPPAERLPASLAAALAAVEAGAHILRVHDVAATVDALKVWRALRPAGNSVLYSQALSRGGAVW